MSFAGEIEGLVSAHVPNEVVRGQLSNIVRLGLDEGLSANEMLSQLRSVGAGIQRASFLGIVRTVRADIEAGRAAEFVDLNQLPPASTINYTTGGKAGVFRQNVRLTIRNPISAGEYSIETTTFTVTSEQLTTPAEAIAAARNIFSLHSDLYGNELVGADYAGTTYNPGY